MPTILMPGGVTEEVGGGEFWWMRIAFPEEWKGAVALRLATSVIYSIESLDELRQKFGAAQIPLAEFTAPDKKISVLVGSRNVVKVSAANPAFHHEKAKSVLEFSRKTKLAVRETVEESVALLKAAGGEDDAVG